MAVSTLAVGLVLAVALRILPSVRLQLAGLALLAVGLPLAAVIVGGVVMFHMNDDVKILAIAAASASTGLAAAALLGTEIARRIRSLETASRELASGSRGKTGHYSGNKILGGNAATAELVSIAFRNERPRLFF